MATDLSAAKQLIADQRTRLKVETDDLVGAPTDMRDIRQTYARRYAAYIGEYVATERAKSDGAATAIDGDRRILLMERTAHHMAGLTVELNDDHLLIIVDK